MTVGPQILGVCAVSLGLLLAGCGTTTGGSSPTASGPGSSSASGGTVNFPDACSLLSADDLTSLGVNPATPTIQPRPTDSEGPQYVGCSWPSTSGSSFGADVLVSTPGTAGVDYVQTVVFGLGSSVEATPVNVGTDGKLYAAYLTLGGGGTGKTVVFKQGKFSAFVSVADTTIDPNTLEAAATKVANKLASA